MRTIRSENKSHNATMSSWAIVSFWAFWVVDASSSYRAVAPAPSETVASARRVMVVGRLGERARCSLRRLAVIPSVSPPDDFFGFVELGPPVPPSPPSSSSSSVLAASLALGRAGTAGADADVAVAGAAAVGASAAPAGTGCGAVAARAWLLVVTLVTFVAIVPFSRWVAGLLGCRRRIPLTSRGGLRLLPGIHTREPKNCKSALLSSHLDRF